LSLIWVNSVLRKGRLKKIAMSGLTGSGDIRICIAKGDDSFCIKAGRFELPACRPVISGDKEEAPTIWRVSEDGPSCQKLRGKNELGEWLLEVSAITNATGVKGIALRLSGRLDRRLRTLRLSPLSSGRFEADHVLVHGRKMGGCSAMVLPVAEKREFESHFMLIFTRGEEKLQLTHPLGQRNISSLSGTVVDSMVSGLTASTVIEFPVPGEIAAEELRIFAEEDGVSLMTSYGEENRANREFSPEPAGWNTWDYYRWTITEDDVLENAEFIRNDPVLSKHVKRIIVDDGWQYCYGEWEANPRFPHGMEWLAGRLTKMGFDPGLWFAPGILEPHARISQWDSEMLAQGESGLPCLGFSCMERKGMILDPTHPRSQAWLEELFERYVSMGYRYFKLDFLAMTLNARRFYDNTIPRGDIIGRLIEPIRRVSRGKAKILGCNYPFNAGTDLVDTVRTSGDIHALWESIEDNVFSIAGRFWSHNRLWVNDPDFALCRGLETSDDPDLQRLKCCHVYVKPEDTSPRLGVDLVLADINEDEVKTLMALVMISGGVINLSDKMIRLNEKGLDIARRAVSATPGEAGIPLDLFSSVRPAYWLQRIPGGNRVLLINWSETEAELCLDLAEAGIAATVGRDFWTDENLKFSHGVLRVVVKPHASLLVEMRQY